MGAQVAQEALTSIGIGVCIVQLERDPLYEVPQVICSPYCIRGWHRGSASYGDSPSVCMVRMREFIPLFLSQYPGSVSIDDGTMYRHSLQPENSQKWRNIEDGEIRTRTRTRSLEAMADAVEASRAGSEVETPPCART